MVSGVLAHRRALVSASIAAAGALALVALTRVEVPVLGLDRLLYVPIVLLALGSGPIWGSVAGAVAGGLYEFGEYVDPRLAAIGSIGGLIRLAGFVAIGWMVGSSATHDRALADRAERDFLTDLPNAHALEAALARRLAAGRAFVLVFADLEGLHDLNEAEGHAAGNDRLRRFAAVLREETPPGDTVARIGGDEFAVLKEIGSQPEAEDVCDRLRAALAARGIGASFGYAMCPDEGDDRLSLFHGADKRLYAAKHAFGERRLFAVS